MSSHPSDESRPSEQQLESLRRAFTALTDETPAPDQCPEPVRIWAAVQGESGDLSAEERLAIIDHTGVCSTCAEEWRLGREMVRQDSGSQTLAGLDSDRQPRSKVLDRRRRFRRVVAPFIGLAAAAMLVWVVGLPHRTETPAFRAGQSAQIESLLPKDQALPRDACILRWSAEEDAVYSILVSDADLAVIVQADDLTESHFQVDPELLTDFESGVELYWQVRAVLPDGTSRGSKTFVTRLD